MYKRRSNYFIKNEIISFFLNCLAFIKQKLIHLITILFVILILVVFNNFNNYSAYIKSFLIETFSQIGEFISFPVDIIDKGLNELISSISTKSPINLQEENNQLKIENEHLKINAFENERLKQLLNFTKDESFKYLTTTIVRATLNLDNRTFIINSGASSKVVRGSVIATGNKLIGKVVEVTSSYSVVQMITNQIARTPVIFIESGEKGIISGNASLTNYLDISYVSNIDLIKDNELVVTSGDGLIYPYGLVVGHVKKDENVTIIPAFDLKSLHFVTVIIPHE